MRIGIVGPGRLGRSLAILFEAAGQHVQLFGRTAVPSGDVLLLTVPDGQIAEVAAAIPVGPIVLHCSGAKGMDVLRPHPVVGSFHPLMSFPGPEVAVPSVEGVPVAVAGDPAALAAARSLAETLKMVPVEVLGDRRLYHAAAVMAGNFATVLLADAVEVLTAAGVEPQKALEMLTPLALASIANASTGPANALTGPVVRNDVATLEAHRTALREAGLEEHARVYDTLTGRAQKLLRAKRTPPSDQS